MKYFNSDLVSKFIIDKTLGINPKTKYLWKLKKLITSTAGDE